MDKEAFTVNIRDLERLISYFDKPLDSNVAHKGDPEQIIEYLVEDAITTRKNANRLIKIAKSFQGLYEDSLIKIKDNKKQYTSAASRLEEAIGQYEILEKSLFVSEEKTEYLTREIEDLEKSLTELHKENERLKKVLNHYKKTLQDKQNAELNNSENERKSLIYYREESSRRVAELQSDLNKRNRDIEEFAISKKALEGKLAAEKGASDLLRAQISSLKNEIFELSTKNSELKGKCFSYKNKIKELTEEYNELCAYRDDLLYKIEELQAKDKDIQYSITELETDDQTYDQASKPRHRHISEVLSDFFVPEETEKGEDTVKESSDLVYFITNPGFKYPKLRDLKFHSGDCINILSPRQSLSLETKNEVTFDSRHNEKQASEKVSSLSVGRLEEIDDNKGHFVKIDTNAEVLTYKDPVKEYFVSVRNS